jgi:hypothetical protein
MLQDYHVTVDGDTTCSNCFMDGIRCVIGERKLRKSVFYLLLHFVDIQELVEGDIHPESA